MDLLPVFVHPHSRLNSFVMRIDALGESCLVWRLGDGPSQETSARVRLACQCIQYARKKGQLPGQDAVLDIVPAYDSLAVYFDPLKTDPVSLQAVIDPLIESANAPGHQQPPATEPVCLTVRYDGLDLAHVAEHTGLTPDEVIRRHTAPIYTVAAIGFLPHFPYLLGLDPALATPRLASPRPRVDAGSVAIGNDQTGVYPQVSPGGWNLLGRTDPRELLGLKTGDRLRFEAVNQ